MSIVRKVNINNIIDDKTSDKFFKLGFAKKAGIKINEIINALNITQYRVPGRFYSCAISQGASATIIQVNNTLRAYPFLVNSPLTVDQIVGAATNAVEDSSYNVGIYCDNGNGYPCTLVPGTNNVFSAAATTAVQYTLPSPVTLDYGLYWIVIWGNLNPTLRGIALTALPNVLGYNPVLSNNQAYTGYTLTETYSDTLPNKFPDGANLLQNTINPMILLRAK